MSITRSTAHSRWRYAIGFGLAGALLVAVVVLAFVWPAATARPRDLPVGIAGPTAQVQQLRSMAARQDPDPFAFTAVRSRADAIARIRDRSLAGAVLLGERPEVLIASAGSSASAQALRGVAANLQQAIARQAEQALIGRLQQTATAAAQARAAAQRQLEAAIRAVRSGRTPTVPAPAASASPSPSTAQGIPAVEVTDVVPLSADDPLGAGLAGAAFPLVLGGMLGGVLVSFLVVGATRRVVALVVYGAAAGTLTVLVLQTWLHVLQGSWILEAAAFGLGMLATASVVVGFNSLLGPRGIAVGAVISLLIGNPISGAAVPYQFIPAPWGAVGQYFVPGAAANLVRSVSYFPDAATGQQWLTLGAWTLGGVLLTVAGHFRDRAPVPLPARELD